MTCRSSEKMAASLRRLTISGEAAAAHAAIVSSLQWHPAVRTEPTRLQVPQLQRFVPGRRAQEVPVGGEAAVRDHVAVVAESKTVNRGSIKSVLNHLASNQSLINIQQKVLTCRWTRWFSEPAGPTL